MRCFVFGLGRAAFFVRAAVVLMPSGVSISRLGVADGVVSPVAGDARSSDDFVVSIDVVVLSVSDFSDGVTTSEVLLKPINLFARSCMRIFSGPGEVRLGSESFSRFVTAGAMPTAKGRNEVILALLDLTLPFFG